MISLTEQGKKHQPLAQIDGENIVITIGREITHPMQEVHLIECVDILMYTKAGLLRVKNFELKHTDEPKITFPVSDLKSGTYKVQTKCNLHGTWYDDFVI
ncbi:MAG: desulfoferrodoxin family protein [Candidatus Gracilibacteria bacterium]|nr:desulfoferrodoxin family protein [Candidatus Gracilibacteria bacterium]